MESVVFINGEGKEKQIWQKLTGGLLTTKYTEGEQPLRSGQPFTAANAADTAAVSVQCSTRAPKRMLACVMHHAWLCRAQCCPMLQSADATPVLLQSTASL